MAQDPKPVADGREHSFIDYRETGNWKSWTDGGLSLRIPEEWHVAIDVPDANKKPSPKTEWKNTHDGK